MLKGLMVENRVVRLEEQPTTGIAVLLIGQGRTVTNGQVGWHGTLYRIITRISRV